ncbi:hypothetical protein F1215_010865 [Escherichia coli]|uniref:hypothetical protein n=1 Tax=Escherichia coli TaxID=562 RepID=UPI0021D4E61D|nr:hypothetical protein [Escherichia coli]
MIISPPFIRAKNNNENDAHWIERMMPVEPDRDYPINYGDHGMEASTLDIQTVTGNQNMSVPLLMVSWYLFAIPLTGQHVVFRRSIIMEAQTMGMFCFVMKLK